WHKIGYVSQKSNAFNKGFPATVYEVVSTGLAAKIGYLKFFTKKHKAKIFNAIEQVGMLPYIHHNIGELCGGQTQRVFIARALASEPELMILDEPTVGVDSKHVKQFYQLLHQLNEEKNMTLLLITRDTDTLIEHVTDVACLNKQLYFHGPPETYQSLSAADWANIFGHSTNTNFHNSYVGGLDMLADFVACDFLRHTFLTGILIGLIAPLLGVFIVVRRLSLLADALSHVTLAGIAFSLFLERRFGIGFISPLYGGMFFSVIGSILVEKLRNVYQSFQELAIPIILSGGVGLGVIFIALANGFNTDLFNYLFGSVSAVSKKDFL